MTLMISRKNKIQKGNIFHNRWIYIVFGIVIMMFLGTVYSYSVFRLELENQFQIGASESGLPYMFALAFYALFMFFTGKFIERIPPKKILICGGLLVSLGWLLSYFSTNIYMLTFTYGCIGGAGVGIAYGVPISVVAKWFPDKKGVAVGLVLVGFGVSPLITAPMMKYLVDLYGVMRTFFILGISFSIIMPLLALVFKYPTQSEIARYEISLKREDKSKDLSLGEMIRTRSFKGVYMNFVIGTMIGLMMIGMTTHVGVDYFKLDTSSVATLLSLFAIFNGLGRPIFGWITDRFSSRVAMILSYSSIALASMALMVFDNRMGLFVISFCIFWFNLGGWLAIAPTSTLKLFGMKHYSQNYGLVFTAYGVGALAGISTSGALLDYHGNYQYIFLYMMLLCLIGIILTVKYIKR